jgi:hypothetical protein
MTHTWADAQAHCAGIWRLPTADELATLIDLRAQAAPLIDSAFTNANAAYWTITEQAGSGQTIAWFVNFGFGGIGFQGVGGTNRVRCVR